MPRESVDSDPLADLLVQSKAIDRSKIASALKGKVAVDRDTGGVVLQAGFRSLGVRQKVLAFLLGRKVAVLLGLTEVELATPADVAAGTGMPPGSARPTMSALSREHRVTKIGSSYELSPAQIDYAIEEVGADAATPASSTRTDGARRGRRRTRKPSSYSDAAPAERTSRPPRKRAVKKTTPKKSPRPAKRAGNSVGPTTLVEELITQGFFDTPRTLNDVQQRLKNKRGYNVKITTLSPVFTRLLRREVLDREQNENGTYVYHKHSS